MFVHSIDTVPYLRVHSKLNKLKRAIKKQIQSFRQTPRQVDVCHAFYYKNHQKWPMMMVRLVLNTQQIGLTARTTSKKYLLLSNQDEKSYLLLRIQSYARDKLGDRIPFTFCETIIPSSVRSTSEALESFKKYQTSLTLLTGNLKVYTQYSCLTIPLPSKSTQSPKVMKAKDSDEEDTQPFDSDDSDIELNKD